VAKDVLRVIAAQVLERQADGARQVLFFVLAGGQHLDELSAAADERAHLVALYVTWHAGSSRRACATTYDLEAMVSFSGGGGGLDLAGPSGIIALLVLAVIVAAAWWLFNR